MKKLLVIALLALLMLSCSVDFNKINLPSWEANLFFTFQNARYAVTDLLVGNNDDEHNFVILNGILNYETHGVLDGKQVTKDQLAINPPVIKPPVTLINNTPITQDISISITDSDVELIEATFFEGKLIFLFSGINPQLGEVRISMPELFDENGDTIVFVYTRQDIQNLNLRIEEDLNGLAVRKIVPQDHHLTKLTPNPIATSATAGPSAELCQIQIFLQGETVENQIYLDYVSGWVNRLEIEAEGDPVEIDIKYPVNIENALKIRDPHITFNFINEVGYDFSIGTVVYAINDRANTEVTEQKSLVSFGIEYAPNMGTAQESVVIFDKEDGVDDLMVIAPNRVEFEDAKYSILQRVAPGFVKRGQTITGNYKVVIPFEFDFHPGEWVEPHPDNISHISLQQDMRDNIRDKTENFSFDVQLWNHYRAGVVVEFYLASDLDNLWGDQVFTDDFTRVVLTQDEFGDPYTIPRFIGPDDDRGVYKKIRFHFREDEGRAGIFYKYPDIYFGFRFSFIDESTSVLADEYIDIIAGLSTKILIDPEDM